MSLQTPLKRHDPMRLTKTVDSVEMLKRKKSTIEKSKLKNKNMFQSEEEGQDEYNGEDSECDLTPHTVPVGKKFTDIKRRVTFDRSASYKFEKIRNDPQ